MANSTPTYQVLRYPDGCLGLLEEAHGGRPAVLLIDHSLRVQSLPDLEQWARIFFGVYNLGTFPVTEAPLPT